MSRVGLPVLLVMTAVLGAFFQQSVYSLSDDEKDQITTGLEAGEKIAELLTSKEFTKALTKIGTSLGPYLGVIGPFVGIILSFIPGQESAELQFMKEMMRKIDNRFDQLDSRFNDIERLIKWTVHDITFNQLEQKILASSAALQDVYKVPPEATESMSKYFLRSYECDYQNSGSKLYEALVNGGNTRANLGIAAMEFTENDRKKTQDFLLGAMQLLLQAVKIDLAYFHAQGQTHLAEYTREQWEKKITEVKQRFESVDREVKSKWFQQSDIDTDEYAAKHSKMSNKDFSAGMYNMLATKFYWRDWFVVIYRDLTGGDKHYVGVRGGAIKFRKHGKNIVYASEDKFVSKLNSDLVQQSLNFACSRCDAHGIFNKIPRIGQTFRGVIMNRNDVWWDYSKDKTFGVTLFQSYTSFQLFIWG